MIKLQEIQARLAEEIKRSHLSQSEIARRLEIKHTQISCYVHGKKMPTLDTLANLCLILDVDPADILLSEKDKKSIHVPYGANENLIVLHGKKHRKIDTFFRVILFYFAK